MSDKSDRMVLNTEAREQVGSKHAVKLRKQGRLPAIVYGHNQDPVAISLDIHEFVEALHHGHRLFDIRMDKKSETLLVKDLQYDYLGKDVIHADLVRVDLAEKVKVRVPIELKGTSKGSHEGGMIDGHLDHLEIECTVSEIPEVIEISVGDIGVGDTLRAGEVKLPDGSKLVTNPEALVLSCHLVTAAKSTEQLEEEMPAAPEVLTAKETQETENKPE